MSSRGQSSLLLNSVYLCVLCHLLVPAVLYEVGTDSFILGNGGGGGGGGVE